MITYVCLGCGAHIAVPAFDEPLDECPSCGSPELEEVDDE